MLRLSRRGDTRVGDIDPTGGRDLHPRPTLARRRVDQDTAAAHADTDCPRRDDIDTAVETVEHLLAAATAGDKAVGPQQAQVMRHRRLLQAELAAKIGNIAFTVAKGHEQAEARPVGQQTEQLAKMFKILLAGCGWDGGGG